LRIDASGRKEWYDAIILQAPVVSGDRHMTQHSAPPYAEPVIAVGLLDECESVSVYLKGSYKDSSGHVLPAGELHAVCRAGLLSCNGVWYGETRELNLAPIDSESSQFSLEATIGINFHWQQRETQSFHGNLQLLPKPDNRLTVINRVSLETYLTSVVCSEMKASSPQEFIKAHAVISRSWLMAQRAARDSAGQVDDQKRTDTEGELLRWTEREAHRDFDVCADDHCQRYQGTSRINAPGVVAAIQQTRGEVLTYNGRPCDARYSKNCGGVSEEYQTAWGDRAVPYLVALRDTRGPDRKPPTLLHDGAMRSFLRHPPSAYCDCTDMSILGSVLNDYDLATDGFFRWRVRLPASDASRLVNQKLATDLGRLLNLEPVERGPSGRLKRLRLVGERGSLVIGKELEIRRVLSETHLYSSAFVVDVEGPSQRPDAFLLTGAGWGHGVGLCQIGAAVMAHQGAGYHEILEHYYPGTEVQRSYS
jgi:stage II sporulation protein D